MFLPPIGYFQRDNWSSFGSGSHPQFEVLKKHIDRAVQDLFLNSLRDQHEDFLYIFENKDQIEKFTEKMIRYWEKEENYEICSEIIKLKKKMISKWKRAMSQESNGGEELKEWINSSL
jgi:Txe/YoeB family toxin of Txe-Axe toxin-antitoxin module